MTERNYDGCETPGERVDYAERRAEEYARMAAERYLRHTSGSTAQADRLAERAAAWAKAAIDHRIDELAVELHRESLLGRRGEVT
jgi:hypothetical protein